VGRIRLILRSGVAMGRLPARRSALNTTLGASRIEKEFFYFFPP
jgi:hypothetical protein